MSEAMLHLVTQSSYFLLQDQLCKVWHPFSVEGRWEAPIILVGVSTLIFFLIEWFLISFARAQFIFPDNFWRDIWVSVFFGMVVSHFSFI